MSFTTSATSRPGGCTPLYGLYRYVRCFQIPPVLKTVFEKLRFRDGLLWTVGLTVEIKLYAFLNSSGVVWMLPLHFAKYST